MNKVVNLFTLILFLLFGFITIGSIYDLGFSVYEINDIPYIKQIAYGLSILILLLGFIRIKRRLEGRKDIKNYKQFIFETPISKQAISNTVFFISIELIFGLGFLAIVLPMQSLDEQNLFGPLLVIITVLICENSLYLIYLISHKSDFRIGISKQFIAYFDREMHLYYFKGLTRIEIYQNMINFQYKKELNLFLNLKIIPLNKQKQFFESLQNNLKDKPVFFDDSFHQYIEKLKM